MEKKLTKKEKELMQEELTNMLPKYCDDNIKEKTLKKELDNLNGQIKNIMSVLKLNEFTSGKYTAHYDIRETKKVNEDKLLQLLTSTKSIRTQCELLGIIKVKEYVDTDALEKAIYNQELGKKLVLEMEKCEDIKKTPVLTFKVEKGE